MLKLTVVVFTALFATEFQTAYGVSYMDQVEQFKLHVSTKIEDYITTVTTDKDNILKELYDELLGFTTNSYQEIINLGETIKSNVAHNKYFNKTGLLLCFGEVDELHRSAKKIFLNVYECAWSQSEASDASAKAIESIFNKTIDELIIIKDTLDKCDKNVHSRSSALKAIICIESADNKAAWMATKLSMPLFTEPNENRIQQIIEHCSTVNKLPELVDNTGNTLTRCNDYIAGHSLKIGDLK